MLSNGTSFQAALLELGQATPLLPLHDSAATSADVSYATSSISGPEEGSVPASTIGVAVASAVEAGCTEADEAAVRDKVEGLPSSHMCDNGGVAEGGLDEKLDVPAISRKDAQAIRDILLGNIKAPKHYSAGVGTGGFLSLAPEWQR